MWSGTARIQPTWSASETCAFTSYAVWSATAMRGSRLPVGNWGSGQKILEASTAGEMVSPSSTYCPPTLEHLGEVHGLPQGSSSVLWVTSRVSPGKISWRASVTHALLVMK